MPGIRDKVVAITGASSGIGEATALLLAERGAKVVLGARGLDRLQALAARIAEAGGDVAYARTDVKRRSDLLDLVKLACDRYGKLDVLVSNAGIAPVSLLDELRVDDWDEMIDINIKGVLYGIAAALPVFRKQGFGHIINTASTAGLITRPTMAVYSGTKFAVRAISEGLRQEAGETLRVTLITPGFVHTNIGDSMTNPEVRARKCHRTRHRVRHRTTGHRGCRRDRRPSNGAGLSAPILLLRGSKPAGCAARSILRRASL